MANLLTRTGGAVAPCPELGNFKLDGLPVIRSADLWVPQALDYDFSELVKKVEYRDPGDGRKTRTVLEEVVLNGQDYLRVPREFSSLLSAKIPHNSVVEPVYERWDFGSSIKLREGQRATYEKALASSGGILALACGKGKTVLGLKLAADRGLPTVVVIENGGIGHQWVQSAKHFLNLSDDEIGYIYGKEAFYQFENTVLGADSVVDRLRETDEVLSKIARDFSRELFPNKPLTSRTADLLPDKDAILVKQLLSTRRVLLRALNSGSIPNWSRPFVVVGMKTLALHAQHLPMWIRQRFGTVIYDEAHHLPAATLQRTANVFFGQRVALTATPEREDGLGWLLRAHVGGIIDYDIKPDMPAKHYVLNQSHRIPAHEARKVCGYQGMPNPALLAAALSKLPRRNMTIVLLLRKLLSEGRKVLVLSAAVEQVETLGALLKDEFGSCGVVHGATPYDLRQDIIRASRVTVATTGVVKEGLDDPDLDTMIMVSPVASWITVVQSKGRIERFKEGKKQPVMVWIRDTFVEPATQILDSALNKLKEFRGVEAHNYDV